MHIKLNGIQVLSAEITMPLSDVWVAKLEANTGEAITGRVTIDFADGAMQLFGAATVSDVINDRAKVRVVAGAGALPTEVGGKAYRDAPASVIVGDILRETGETLSGASDSEALRFVLKHWVRLRNPARRELKLLMLRLGLSWRALPDGTIWIGSESWPQSKLTSYTLIEDIRQEARLQLMADVPAVYPGETFRDRHVIAVEHNLDGSKISTMVYFDD